MTKIFTGLITLLALLVFTAKPIFAKSYTIDNADINITIQKDGSAAVTETRQYTFSGHFENGVWFKLTDKNKIDINQNPIHLRFSIKINTPEKTGIANTSGCNWATRVFCVPIKNK